MNKLVRNENINFGDKTVSETHYNYLFFLLLLTVLSTLLFVNVLANEPSVKLGNEVLLDDYIYLIDGKKWD